MQIGGVQEMLSSTRLQTIVLIVREILLLGRCSKPEHNADVPVKALLSIKDLSANPPCPLMAEPCAEVGIECVALPEIDRGRDCQTLKQQTGSPFAGHRWSCKGEWCQSISLSAPPLCSCLLSLMLLSLCTSHHTHSAQTEPS